MLKRYGSYLIWTLTGIIIILFWFSLRDQEHRMEYTLAAIVVWGITYLVNRMVKNEKDQEKE